MPERRCNMQRRDFLAATSILLGGISAFGLNQALASSSTTVRIPLRAISDRQRRTVAVLSEIFIPRTDTPGAIDAGVPDFIITILSDWYTDAEFNIFADGLAWLDAQSHALDGGPYINASEGIQTQLLREMETQASAYDREHPVVGNPTDKPQDQYAPFFRKLKELVVVGYYTSQPAAFSEMVYVPIPNRYSGDASLAQSQGKQYIW
jgi:hypothetical protein